MKSEKRKTVTLILVLLLFGVGVGFAALSTDLKISGTSKINSVLWNVHFENLNVSSGSVAIGSGNQAAAIDTTTTSISYNVTLSKPGDFYEFTVDAVNSGSINGLIESVSSKMNDVEITTLPDYLNYSVTFLDGTAIEENHELNSGETDTYKVRIEYKKDIIASQLPTTEQTLNLSFSVSYKQASDGTSSGDITYAYRSNENYAEIGSSLTDLGVTYMSADAVISETGYNYFLKHKLEGGFVNESSLGFSYNGNQYYLVGGDGGASYETNKTTLQNAFGSDKCTDTGSDYFCDVDGIYVDAVDNGYVEGHDDVRACYVYDDGSSLCE